MWAQPDLQRGGAELKRLSHVLGLGRVGTSFMIRATRTVLCNIQLAGGWSLQQEGRISHSEISKKQPNNQTFFTKLLAKISERIKVTGLTGNSFVPWAAALEISLQMDSNAVKHFPAVGIACNWMEQISAGSKSACACVLERKEESWNEELFSFPVFSLTLWFRLSFPLVAGWERRKCSSNLEHH